MNFHDCAADFLNHLRFERGLSPTTCLSYQCWLRHYSDWLASERIQNPTLANAFNLPILRKYLYHKAKANVRPRTLHSAFAPLRSLGAFLVANGALETNPARELTLPKKDAARRLTVTDAEVASLFDACDRLPKPRTIALAHALLAILCYGGLRRSEVCNLRVEDVNLEDGSLLVRSGKGAKSRRVFICAEGVQAVREWLLYREADCQGDWLLMFDRRRRLGENSLAHLLESVAAAAGLRDNAAIRPHSLRHWALTNLLRNGANLKDIQQFAGHTAIETTSRYLHSNEEQLRGIAELTALRRTEKPKPANVVDARERFAKGNERKARRIGLR